MTLRNETRNDCPHTRHLDALLDDRLDAERRLRLKEHVARCPVCREERAQLLALRRLSRALPQPTLSSVAVQRAKSALLDRDRRRTGPRRSIGAALNDYFAERPAALHTAAVLAGILISVFSYGIGRWHGTRGEASSPRADHEVAAIERPTESPASPPRLESFIDPMGMRTRNEPGDLVIESLSEPDPDSAVIPPTLGDDPRRLPTTDLASADEEPRGEILRPTAGPIESEGPVAFSAEALEVLERSGSVDSVLKQIGEAAPNWAKILSIALPEALEGKIGDDGKKDARNMVVSFNDGGSQIRLHLTIVFGMSIEPRVQVNRAEAKPLEKIPAPKGGER
ncbi:MAG: zf-HC2 domain-containing protein [Planctomycetes bacterium]|nr:zf-HC2 domain-containing protein [Planctomycetota bacterium]